jgi:hypothetical protein
MLLLESENSLKNKASEKNFNFFQNFAPEFPEKYVKSWINECKIKLLETPKAPSDNNPNNTACE